MPEFLRRNPMIVAGIALPVIVALFFVLATIGPRLLVEPPAYDVLFTGSENRAAPRPVEVAIVVEDGRVLARAYNVANNYRVLPGLYRYDVSADTVERLDISMPQGDFEDGAVLPIESLADVRVSTSRRAPDGYEVVGPDYRGGGLLGVFFGPNRYNVFSLRKDGAVYAIPEIRNEAYYYGNDTFLGWVIDDE